MEQVQHLSDESLCAISACADGHLKDAAEAELLSRHEGLIRKIACDFNVRVNDVDDALQSGRIGLLCAARRFDPGRGVKLTTFATPFIIGEIVACINDITGTVTAAYAVIPTERLADVAVEDLVLAANAESTSVLHFLASLDERDRTIMFSMFWYGDRAVDVARQLKISRSAVSQRMRRVFDAGKEALA